HLRPDRQGHDLLRRVPHPERNGPPDEGTLPAGRATCRAAAGDGVDRRNDGLTLGEPADARPDGGLLPIDLERPGPTAFHRLNPLTKLVLATATAVGAVVVGGVIGPLTLVLVAVVLPALYARELRRLARTSLLVSLPIGLSALLVNVFFFP